MKLRAIALLLMLQCSIASAGCPTGSYQWVDDWGNKICKDFGSGGARTIEGSTDRCPTGTYRWVDEWGNKICKAFGSGREWHDTSKGCPTGSYPWVDDWGNKICKKY